MQVQEFNTYNKFYDMGLQVQEATRGQVIVLNGSNTDTMRIDLKLIDLFERSKFTYLLSNEKEFIRK